MYLYVERLWRNPDDSWFTEPHLVNFDHAGDVSLDWAGVGEGDLVKFRVQFAGGLPAQSFYFGPADMTELEKTARLQALYGALQGGPSVQWTWEGDASARLEGRKLSQLTGL
jgi:hypothetical protein